MYAKRFSYFIGSVHKSGSSNGHLFSVGKLAFIYSLLMYTSVLCSSIYAVESKGNDSAIVENNVRNLIDKKRVIISAQKRNNNQDLFQGPIVASNVTQKSISGISKDSSNESPSPSTLSSIYDYINSRRQQENKQTATKVLPIAGASSFQQQFGINGIRSPSQDYNVQRTVALGRENDDRLIPSHKQSSQLDKSGIIQPFLLTANGNALQGSVSNHHIIPNKQLYSTPVALKSNENYILMGDQHHHINNNLDGHYQLPPVMEMLPIQNNQHQHVYPRNVGPQIYKTRGHHQVEGNYEAAKNPYKQQVRQEFQQYPTENHLDFIQNEAENKENSNKKRFSPLIKEEHFIVDGIRGKIYPDTSKLNERQRLLSNEQLVSLIDELKEFNSRKASKIGPAGIIPSMALTQPPKKVKLKYKEKNRDSTNSKYNYKKVDSGSNLNETEDSDDYPEGSDDKSSSRGPENYMRHPNQTNGMSTDDLAKFAKFLMSKEGSNLKFQLGLDKESIDDGDFDDEKDALLESNEKQTKAKPKSISSRRMEALDRNYKNAAINMNQMYDRLGNKVRDADRELNRRKILEKLKRRQRLNSVESNKARNKRNREESSSEDFETSKVQRASPTSEQEQNQEEDNGSYKANPKEANFAKLLINQEILEDQRESAQDSPTSSSKKVEKSDKDDYNHDLHPSNSQGKSKVPVDVNSEPSPSRTRAEYGEEEDQYTVGERAHDNTDLLNDLQKTRKTKSKTRSRIPIPVDNLLKRALDGDLGLRTEKRPDGKLLLKDTARGNVAILDLPPKSGDFESEQASISTEEDGSLNSELVPSYQTNSGQHDGSQGSNNVLVHSSEPLRDEYPISERVSAGLNKLSNNLDRYFNDGFLAEIETKSKDGINQDNNNKNNQKRRNKESHQPESSNVNEAARQLLVDEIQKGTNRKLEDDVKDKVEKKIKGRVDHDFDVDVGIDGKRDNDGEDFETNRSEDLDTKDDDNEKSNLKKLKVKPLRKMKTKNELRRKDSLSRTNSNNKDTNRKAKGKILKETSKNNSKIEKELPVTDANDNGTRSVSRDMTTRSEKVEFENHGRIAPNLDPVESENLETPIGPDSDNGVEADIVSEEKTKSTKGTEVSATYGKKVPGKFYEEPEW